MSAGATIAVEALAGDADFRCLRTLPGVEIDLRYASERNLLGRDLYSPHDCAWLHAEAAAALAEAAGLLAQQRPDLRLRVLDAARPQRVQQQFWSYVVGTPMQPYFAPPERRSMHSFGMAIDITLADAGGAELDMGSGFDDTRELSHPALEEAHLRNGLLQPAQLENRLLLRGVMQRAGWQPIATEWWHFDFGDREQVRAEYALIV